MILEGEEYHKDRLERYHSELLLAQSSLGVAQAFAVQLGMKDEEMRLQAYRDHILEMLGIE